jgi:hypothetical protein
LVPAVLAGCVDYGKITILAKRAPSQKMLLTQKIAKPDAVDARQGTRSGYSANRKEVSVSGSKPLSYSLAVSGTDTERNSGSA